MQTTARRRSDRFNDRRRQILDAAAPLFNQKGLGGTTLAEVAAAVGLITTSVTYYYRRKDDLAAACLMRTIDAYEGLIAQAATRPDPAARLTAFIEGYFDLLASIAEGRGPALMNFFDIRSLTGAAVDPAFSAFNEMFRNLRGIMRPAPDRPAFPQPEENARVHLTLSVILWARTWAARYDPMDYPRIAARLSDILVHGLAPDANWAPPAIALPAASAEDTGPGLSRADFLKAATETINDFGYHGASVDAIAARLNVTKGAFYHHISAKDDLVLSCFDRSFGAVHDTQKAALDSGLGHWDRLIGVTDALVRRQVEDQPLLRHMAIAAAHAEVRTELRDAMERQTEHYAGLIADAAAEGVIRPVDPAIAAQMVAETINAAPDLARWTAGRLSADEASRFYVRPLFINGVLKS